MFGLSGDGRIRDLVARPAAALRLGADIALIYPQLQTGSGAKDAHKVEARR